MTHPASTLCFLLALTATSGRAQEQRLPSILGKVLNESGKPAPGVDVVLRWRVHPELPGIAGRTLGDRGLAQEKRRTDKRGRYRFKPPHRGPFMLLAESGAGSSVREFPVMAGDRRVLKLEETPWLAGKVTTPAGKPGAGLRVRLIVQQQGWSRLACYRVPERRAGTTTDASGKFRLKFELGYLRAPRWGTFMLPWVDNAGTSNPDLPIIRPGAAGGQLQLALTAPRPLRGTLIDRTSKKPLAGVTIHDTFVRGRTTKTDAEGKFTLARPAGPVWARSSTHAPAFIATDNQVVPLIKGARLRARLMRDAQTPLANAHVLLVVASLEWLPLEWSMRTDENGGVEIPAVPNDRNLYAFVERDGTYFRFYRGMRGVDRDLGTVTVGGKSLSGRIESALGEPLPGARVALMSKNLTPDDIFRVTFTDRLGRFTFDAVPDGDAVVSVVSDGNGMTNVPVAAKAFAEPLLVRLPKGRDIRGKVLDPDGKPAAAWVTIWRSPIGHEIRGPSDMTTQCVQTNSKGEFVFRGVAGTGWTVQSKYLRDGDFYDGIGSETPGTAVVLQSTREAQ